MLLEGLDRKFKYGILLETSWKTKHSGFGTFIFKFEEIPRRPSDPCSSHVLGPHAVSLSHNRIGWDKKIWVLRFRQDMQKTSFRTFWSIPFLIAACKRPITGMKILEECTWLRLKFLPRSKVGSIITVRIRYEVLCDTVCEAYPFPKSGTTPSKKRGLPLSYSEKLFFRMILNRHESTALLPNDFVVSYIHARVSAGEMKFSCAMNRLFTQKWGGGVAET